MSAWIYFGACVATGVLIVIGIVGIVLLALLFTDEKPDDAARHCGHGLTSIIVSVSGLLTLWKYMP